MLICRNVWVGAGTLIAKGSVIGEHVVIGGNSVVKKILNHIPCAQEIQLHLLKG
ncbi:hypothetical protein [Klebsiella pneumoniae]|uniref:hypothetical protein n=1 Tax=Klebsiella pneumoniae TaxID=573 RepID=UPI0039747C7A|nr:transferase [Klebsiella pneumoniae]